MTEGVPVGDAFEVDLNDLTMGEVEEIETIIGGSIAAVFGGTQPLGKASRAVYYVVKRREDPDLTYEDTADLKFTSLRMRFGPTDPTSAGV
jgi:hypothetical protein